MLYNSIVCNNIRLMSHTVVVCKLAYNLTRVSRRKHMRRYIFNNNTACSYYATIAYCNSTAYHNICTQPTVIAYVYGFCITKTPDVSVFVSHCIAFIGKHRMYRCYYRNVRTEITIIAYCYKWIANSQALQAFFYGARYAEAALILNVTVTMVTTVFKSSKYIGLAMGILASSIMLAVSNSVIYLVAVFALVGLIFFRTPSAANDTSKTQKK